MSLAPFTINHEAAYTASAVRTQLQIVPGTNHAVEITEITVSFKGTDPAGEPLRVAVLYQSGAGTSNDVTSTYYLKDSWVPETLEGTVRDTFTSTEPTTTREQESERVHPQGAKTWRWPEGKGLRIGTGERLGITIIGAANNTANIHIRGSE